MLLLATLSSVLRFLVHSFIVALFIPVLLLIIYLKLTIPRSMGILGSSRPYWDYIGSSYWSGSEPDLLNPYATNAKRVTSQDKVKRRKKAKGKETGKEKSEEPEKVDEDDLKARAQVAGEVWLAETDGEVLGCIARDGWSRDDVYRICRLVIQSWYRREGLGKLLVQSLEAKARQKGVCKVYAHVPFPSKVGEVFFRKLGYRLQGETNGLEGEEEDYEEPQKGWLGFPVTKVFVKDL